MELCYRFRVLTALWCSVEILFFCGIIYGWGSLVFVLKQEGFYMDDCEEYNGNNSIETNVEKLHEPANASYDLFHEDDVAHLHAFVDDHSTTDVGCLEAEANLNKWFSIAVGFMYIGLAGFGKLIQKFGTRLTRGIFMYVFTSILNNITREKRSDQAE